MLGRTVARRRLRHARAKGRCLQNVLVAGHEWSVLDLVAELRGNLPADTCAVGVQPGRVEMGVFLSPEVEGSLDRLVTLAVERLGDWGHRCTRTIAEQHHA